MSSIPKNQEILQRILQLTQDSAIQRFIRDNEHSDIHKLALKSLPNPDWPRTEIINQIQALKIARRKMPHWCDIENLIFPMPDVMEQASSHTTATYKASLINGTCFADLSSGTGLDSFALSQNFESGHCVERDECSAALLRHNLEDIVKAPITVHKTDALSFLQDIAPTLTPAIDTLYIDPQRRTDTGKTGLIHLKDTDPNILELLPLLDSSIKTVMIKTSPVLDIDRVINDLTDINDHHHVAAVHIVEWQGSCREVLYILKAGASVNAVKITAVSLHDDGTVEHQMTVTRAEEKEAQVIYSAPLTYICEPSPAFMKSGAYGYMANHYDLGKLHPHTHLYTADKKPDDFPGRVFELQAVISANKKAVKEALPAQKANLAVRNFPDTPEMLKKKLKLKDGGQDYLFACTLHDHTHALLLCRKAV